ncbi:P-loop containing nucleoside triphosphate hydrolase protein [Fimicolochytrium jonesii]|uniref:P-loop containing nucleoside triphosphate hydrolase protein n=1 Tax=Fimicolochytrium jonesii TaxID=1396493 RepID=UPI0022FDF521|nr:P-loop containing nucleoside triphosphate hydrolase protein [Fimicolochytrium jonesii]KAI8824027.1 P-loop containing nucleoside triphosphate hydrolase protein [Fimicolochytrium jonesii]
MEAPLRRGCLGVGRRFALDTLARIGRNGGRSVCSSAVRRHNNPLNLPPRPAPPRQPRTLPDRPPPPPLPRMARGLPVKTPIAGVKHVVAVASGKGGVGKSTTAVNLAATLANHQNLRVGLLDADLFGPSIPLMLNLRGHEPELNDKGMLVPLVNYGVKAMSMGFLVREEDAVVWRGLMVMKALEQLLRQVDWAGTDVLVIDMPPGTGDTQLTITQQVPLDGAIIVSTPQDISLADAKKGVAMFNKVNVPILGMVQNMSHHICTNCGHTSHVFGHGGVKRTAAEMGLPLLGDIPLHSDVCETSDVGTPIVVARPDSEHARVYREMGEKVWAKLSAGKKV